LQMLEQAFWHRLWEKEIVPRKIFELDRLPEEEKFEPIRSFLFQLQALQYSKDKTFDRVQLKQKAQQLFGMI
jgi:hypothetical protein